MLTPLQTLARFATRLWRTCIPGRSFAVVKQFKREIVGPVNTIVFLHYNVALITIFVAVF